MVLVGEDETAEQVNRVLSFWQAHEPSSRRHTTAEVIAMIKDSIACFQKTYSSEGSRDIAT